MSDTTTTSKPAVTVGQWVYWGRGNNLGGAAFVGLVHAVDGDTITVSAYGGLMTFKREELE